MSLINISTKRVLFLGYGAVAKAVWNYMNRYFIVNPSNIYLLDKSEKSFYGPMLEKVNCIVQFIDATNFEKVVSEILFEGDIIIDLTFCSATYSFIETCFVKGYHYINTSIEDNSDLFKGHSIDYQQQQVYSIYEKCKKHTIRSCIVTECGQNPGLIQHYVLYALQQLHETNHPDSKKRYDKVELTNVISECKIGTILMSERDQLKTSRTLSNSIHNTWSVAGFIMEGLDEAELVRGTKNKFIQPIFSEQVIHSDLMKLYEPHQMDGKQVIFLRSSGLNSYMTSISPVIRNGNIMNELFQGELIHHGEIFELASYFGDMSPFMSYVYQSSPYFHKTITPFIEEYGKDNLITLIKSNPDSFRVMDNIGIQPEHHMKGFDSIGCTLFCGEETVDKIYWCGSILSDTDKNVLKEISPTIVQVAAGVLSGLSFILEPNRTPGYYPPCRMDTDYILNKSRPLLGTFFFTEIKESFPGFQLDIKK